MSLGIVLNHREVSREATRIYRLVPQPGLSVVERRCRNATVRGELTRALSPTVILMVFRYQHQLSLRELRYRLNNGLLNFTDLAFLICHIFDGAWSPFMGKLLEDATDRLLSLAQRASRNELVRVVYAFARSRVYRDSQIIDDLLADRSDREDIFRGVENVKPAVDSLRLERLGNLVGGLGQYS